MHKIKESKSPSTMAHDDVTNTYGVHAGVDNPLEKRGETLIEHRGLNQTATNISSNAAHLSTAHQEYLLELHGTLDLDPVPGHGNADPYNWPKWKVLP